jgi:lipopolysaccharide/colanic/teichoic acid biosynthesis glycosyltransferase
MTATSIKDLPDFRSDSDDVADAGEPSAASLKPVNSDRPTGGADMATAAASVESETQARNDGVTVPDYAAVPAHRTAAWLKRLELPLLLAIGLAPALVLWAALGRVFFTEAFEETSLALIASIVLSWYILFQLKDHANARHLSYVLPVNLIVFAAVLSLVALLRIPYSGSFFTTGAVSAVAASFLAAVYTRRLAKPHLVVAGGRAAEILLDSKFRKAPSLKELERLIETGWREWAIVADLHHPHSKQAERLFAKAALARIPVYHFRQIAEMQSGQVKISHLSENDLGSLNPNISYTSLKRAIDIIGALVLIPLCIPLFAVISILIKLDSPGNAFFIQERMGYQGRTFRMIKFRTMRDRDSTESAADMRDDAMTKSDDDRITRIGRVLRKTRLDELPQVFNVLRGQMSLIGPRPEACQLSAWYDAELPFYPYRHIVRPGITGWAQVNQGHVTDVSDVLDKLRFDFYYIKNLSLWLDLLIALKTVRVMVQGIGAR